MIFVCTRALVTALHKQDWTIKKSGKVFVMAVQTVLAKSLHVHCGVPLGKCGIDEIKKCQSFMEGYQMYVLSRDHFNGIIYHGPKAYKKMYLYKHGEHYKTL